MTNNDERRVLTVGQLRDALATLPPETEVVIATDGWFTNIDTVIIPDDFDFMCVTLYPAISEHGDYDPRQHAFGMLPTLIKQDAPNYSE